MEEKARAFCKIDVQEFHLRFMDCRWPMAWPAPAGPQMSKAMGPIMEMKHPSNRPLMQQNIRRAYTSNRIRTQRKESRCRILGQNPDKSLLAIQSHLYSFALRFFFFKLPQPLWQFLQRALVYIVKKKGGKPDRKPHLLFYGLRNPYRNIKSENSKDFDQKPQRNCTFMNSASGPIHHNDGTCL